MPRATGISSEIFRTLKQHPGEIVDAKEVNNMLGNNNFSHDSISGALGTLCKKGMIERTMQGWYRYTGEIATDQDEDQHYYESIGNMQDGSVLVRNEDGQEYVLITFEQYARTKIER